MNEQEITTPLNIVYTPLGNNRFLRTLEVEDKRLFIIDNLNLGVIKVRNKQALKTDFEICRAIIKNKGGKVKATLSK